MFLEGVTHLIKADMIKEGAAVIDIGEFIKKLYSGKLW